MSQTYLPPKLAEIVEDFEYCEGQEKLEYLLEFAERLPPLPEWLAEKHGEMDEVHECMTPVFVYGEPNDDGTMHFYFDAPPESPTVRGLCHDYDGRGQRCGHTSTGAAKFQIHFIYRRVCKKC